MFKSTQWLEVILLELWQFLEGKCMQLTILLWWSLQGILNFLMSIQTIQLSNEKTRQFAFWLD